MGSALRFKHTNVPRQSSEQARIKVIQGPDVGAIYVLTGQRATMGRGESCDVVISDLKASRQHAEFNLTNKGWSFRDLGSANGVIHNGKVVRGGDLRSGDILTLGESTFEFMTSFEVGTMMLTAPAKSMEQVQAEQSALEAQKKRIQALTKVGGGVAAWQAPGGASPGADAGEKRRRILIALVALLGLWTLFEEEQPTKKSSASGQKKAAAPTDARNLAAYLPSAETSEEVSKTAEVFFRSGFREFREQNYLRARSAFETVLQIDPGHRLAQLYLENSKQAIENEVSFHLERGRKTFEAGRVREAKGHYEAVLRLLYRDRSHPGFTEAEDQLRQVKSKMKGES